MKNWWEDQLQVRDAIDFLVRYRYVFSCPALVSNTPCCNYREVDQMIPAGLKKSLEEYYDNLTINERRNLNAQFSIMLGERFFVRRSALIRLLCRLLYNGDPRNYKNTIKSGLQRQIKLRQDLLAAL